MHLHAYRQLLACIAYSLFNSLSLTELSPAAITMAILLSPAAAHSKHNVMKNTPRKNTLAIKPRDEDRFWWYLLHRVAITCLSVFAVGWLASASPLLNGEEGLGDEVDHAFSSGHAWTERMASWREAKLGGRRGQAHFLHVQVNKKRLNMSMWCRCVDVPCLSLFWFSSIIYL